MFSDLGVLGRPLISNDLADGVPAVENQRFHGGKFQVARKPWHGGLFGHQIHDVKPYLIISHCKTLLVDEINSLISCDIDGKVQITR